MRDDMKKETDEIHLINVYKCVYTEGWIKRVIM